MKKKVLSQRLRSMSLYDMCQSIDDITRLFNGLVKAYSEYTNLRIELEYGNDTYGDSYTQFMIMGDRLETDKEYQRRLRSDEKEKANAEKRGEKKRAIELKELARLKKKYETTSNSKSK